MVQSTGPRVGHEWARVGMSGYEWAAGQQQQELTVTHTALLSPLEWTAGADCKEKRLYVHV